MLLGALARQVVPEQPRPPLCYVDLCLLCVNACVHVVACAAVGVPAAAIGPPRPKKCPCRLSLSRNVISIAYIVLCEHVCADRGMGRAAALRWGSLLVMLALWAPLVQVRAHNETISYTLHACNAANGSWAPECRLRRMATMQSFNGSLD
jgi:hypothetical protein